MATMGNHGDWIGADRAARRLGVSRGSAVKLMDCGLLGPVVQRGNRTTVSSAAVDALAALPLVASHPPTTVIRMGVPVTEDQGWRDRYGYHETWSAQQKRDAIRGNWICDPFAVTDSGLLVAVVVLWVVAVYEVTGVDRREWDPEAGRHRYRFSVRRPARDVASSFVGRRFEALDSGWVLKAVA